MTNHLFVCVVYIPLQNSKSTYSANVDYFKQLSDGVAKFSAMGDIILTGDFNSCVGNDDVSKAIENLDKFSEIWSVKD